MKRRYWIVIGSAVAVVLLIGFGLWAYKEHQMKRTVMIQMENHYQQSFHELTYYVDTLEESIGKASAMQSRESMRPQLAETWRLSTLAHAAANQLPLTLLPFNRTNEFLAHVGTFTFNSGVKTISDRPLSKKEYKDLQKLYKESVSIRNELRNVQNKVMERHLRWMDVETALKSKKENHDNQVIDGMKRINVQATDYTASFSPENPRNDVVMRKRVNPLSGTDISRAEAPNRLKQWVRKPQAKLLKSTESGKGAIVPAFELFLEDHGRSLNGLVTKKGGHVAWFLFERSVNKETITIYEASKKAEAFLSQRGIKNMELTKRNKFRHTAVLTYVLHKGNVRVYPASIKIKVALDNGELLGVDQSDYLLNKCNDAPLHAKLSETQARKELNSDLNVQESRLVIFQNDTLKNVLCYEFFATRDNDTYRVLINAMTGAQEKVERLNE